MIGLLACNRVGQLAISFEAPLNLVKQRCLSHRVAGAEVCGALEHDMLQVVGQTRGLCRVVLSSSAHGNVRLDARLLLIHAQINLQAVLQRVDSRVQGIARNRLVLVLLRRYAVK